MIARPHWDTIETRALDRDYVLSPEFARLLRFAKSEGLLTGLLQACAPDLLPLAPQTVQKSLPVRGRRRPQ